MGEKVNVYIDLKDETLRERVCEALSEDWSIQWRFVSRDENKINPDEVDIAVIDSPSRQKTVGRKVSVIYLGQAEDDSSFFTTVDAPDADLISKAVRRAFSFQEITRQNSESQYGEKRGGGSLETMAQTLSIRLHQMMKQSEMRIALVDQLPVGVLGVDDENMVVLANHKAIDLLAMHDTPLWGLPVCVLLSDDAGAFLCDDNAGEMCMEKYGERIVIRKARFMLDNSFAGTILVLWKPDEYKKEGAGK